MDRPYPTSLTFTPTPLEVAESSIVAPIIFSVFVTTNTALLQQVLIFDGLSRDHLQWTDHIVTVFKKCMLLDLSFDASSAVIVPDAAGPPFSSRSRRPMPIVNGYSITFPKQPASDSGNWRLERGQFIHQMDGLIVVQSPASN
jgi:hypothetical protein